MLIRSDHLQYPEEGREKWTILFSLLPDFTLIFRLLSEKTRTV